MRINRTEVQPSVTSQTEKGRDEPTSSTAPFRPSATVTSNDDHGDDGRFLLLPRALAPVSPRARHIGLPRYRGGASSRVGVPVLHLRSFVIQSAGCFADHSPDLALVVGGSRSGEGYTIAGRVKIDGK